MKLENLLPNMEKFKVRYPETLFEPTYEEFRGALRGLKCPLCGNKLKEMRNTPRLYCNGKKHRKNFTIAKEKFDRIVV